MARKLFDLFIYITVLLFSIMFAYPLGKFYEFILQIPSSYYSFFIPDFWISFLSGLSFAYIFFMFLFFVGFGDKYKFWWLVIGSLPVIVFVAYFDFSHFYFPILLGLFGWVAGIGISKVRAAK